MLPVMTAPDAANPGDDEGLPQGPRMPGWQGRPRPTRVDLTGTWCRLEPLSTRHSDDLFAASVAPGAADRFRYLLEAVPDRAGHEVWLAGAAASPDPMFWAVCDAVTGACGGRQALMRITPEHGVVEIGSIMWGPGVAGTRVATEALFLTARHVFDDLGYRRFEWKCNDRNLPSRRAARRFGFAFEGIFRQAVVIRGVSRDTAWYAMTDEDWQRLRPAFQAWLDPANFDEHGHQRRPLQARTQAADDVGPDLAAL